MVAGFGFAGKDAAAYLGSRGRNGDKIVVERMHAVTMRSGGFVRHWAIAGTLAVLAGAGTPQAGNAAPADSTVTFPEHVRMPAEFETNEALLVGAAQMVQFHPQALVSIVRAAHTHIRLVCLVGFREERDAAARLLLDAGLPGDSVTFFYLPVQSMWTRDYGPLTVLGPQGTAYFLDATYARAEADPADDAAPQVLGRYMRTGVVPLPLTMEGGDLLSSGAGLCLSTQRVISRNADARGDDVQQIWSILQRYGGFTDWVPLPSLVGEPTGHLDMYLTLVDPHTAVVAQLDPEADTENAARLDWVARTLRTRASLTVERIPMPPHDDGVWRTYTNVVFANGVLLVPAYPDRFPDLDAQARSVYQRLLPDWQIVGVDASSLIQRGGALHCVTMNLPVINDPEF